MIVVTRHSDPLSKMLITYREEHLNGVDFRTGNGGQLDVLDNLGRNSKAYGAGVWLDVERMD